MPEAKQIVIIGHCQQEFEKWWGSLVKRLGPEIVRPLMKHGFSMAWDAGYSCGRARAFDDLDQERGAERGGPLES